MSQVMRIIVATSIYWIVLVVALVQCDDKDEEVINKE
jgi:hypothetical protein